MVFPLPKHTSKINNRKSSIVNPHLPLTLMPQYTLNDLLPTTATLVYDSTRLGLF